MGVLKTTVNTVLGDTVSSTSFGGQLRLVFSPTQGFSPKRSTVYLCENFVCFLGWKKTVKYLELRNVSSFPFIVSIQFRLWEDSLPVKN